MKISKNSSSKYQKTKKSFKAKPVKGIKIFLKKRETRSDNTVEKNIKILLEDEKQRLFEYRRHHKTWKNNTRFTD